MTITINGKIYKHHRIIWLWMTGEWPEGLIDHRDRDAMNNRWGNLRDATPSINSHNQDMHGNNTSGTSRVCWDKSQRKWRVDSVGGKFAGSFKTKEEAVAYALRIVAP